MWVTRAAVVSKSSSTEASLNAPKRTRRAAAAAEGRADARTPTPTSFEPASPIIKWVGGKARLLDVIARKLPKTIGHYFEPFSGGAAVFFSLAPARATLADQNPDLIAMYQGVADDVERVIWWLGKFHRAHDEAHYYEFRAAWNQARHTWEPARRAAGFIYLNKTCYNGLWRVNRAGHYNVPMGRYANPTICAAEPLRRAARRLAGTKLLVADFATTVAGAGRGDVVYFDPPYVPLTPSANFTSYTKDEFGYEAQARLAEVARDLKRRGATVILSNSDAPLVHELYRGFDIERVLCNRAVNSNAAKRGAIFEVIIS